MLQIAYNVQHHQRNALNAPVHYSYSTTYAYQHAQVDIMAIHSLHNHAQLAKAL